LASNSGQGRGGKIDLGSHASILHNAQYRLFTLFALLKLSSKKKKKHKPRQHFVEKFSPISLFPKKLPPFKMAAYKGSDEDIHLDLSIAQ